MSSGPYVYEKLAQLQDQDRNVSHAQGLYWLLGDIRSSTRSTGECMRSREEDSLVGRAAFRACFPWQTQLSKKRDFLPILFPVRV